jgi:hypothetical protein
MLVTHACYSNYWEAEIRGILVLGSRPARANSLWPISKITRAKWTGGVVQVVEHLLCKCKGVYYFMTVIVTVSSSKDTKCQCRLGKDR